MLQRVPTVVVEVKVDSTPEISPSEIRHII